MSTSELRQMLAEGEDTSDYSARSQLLASATKVATDLAETYDNSQWKASLELLAEFHAKWREETRSGSDGGLSQILGLLAALQFGPLKDHAADGSIHAQAPSSELSPLRDDDLASFAVTAACVLFTAFEEAEGTPDVLLVAIALLKRVLATLGQDCDSKDLKVILSSCMTRVFEVTSSRGLIDQSIEICQTLVAQGAPGEKDYPLKLHNLASALLARDASRNDIHEAIELLRESVTLSLSRPEDPCLVKRRNTLGVALTTQCEGEYDPEALDEAISELRKAALSPFGTPPDRLRARYSLARALHVKGLRSTDPATLREAADLLCQALEKREDFPDTAYHGMASRLLGGILEDLYGQTNDDLCLVDSIIALKQAACNRRHDFAVHSIYVAHLARSLTARYGEAQTLADAHPIARQYLALVATAGNEEARAVRDMLANMLWQQFRQRETEADLREAIAAIRDGLDNCSTYEEYLHYAGDLADAHRAGYELFGRAEDLDLAISYAEQLCEMTIEHNGVGEGKAQLLLGGALFRRLDVEYSKVDDDRARTALARALDLPIEPRFRGQAKCMLGYLTCTKGGPDSRAGLQLLREGLAESTTQLERRNRAETLGRALLQRSEAEGDPQLLEEVIALLPDTTDTAASAVHQEFVLRRDVLQPFGRQANLSALLRSADRLVDSFGDHELSPQEILISVVRALARPTSENELRTDLVQAGGGLIARLVDGLPAADPYRALALLSYHHGIPYQLNLAGQPSEGAPTVNEILGLESEAGHGPREVDAIQLIPALLAIHSATDDIPTLRWVQSFLRKVLANSSLAERAPVEYNDMALLYGTLLRTDYEETGDATILNEAVDLVRRIPKSPSQALLMATFQGFVYDATGDRAILADAINELRAQLESGAPGAPEGPGCDYLWFLLGSLLRKEYEGFGDTRSLAEAVSAGRKAIELASDEDQRISYESEQSGALRMQAQREEDLDAYCEALDMSRRVLERTPKSDPALADRWNRTAVFLQILAEWTGDRAALKESIALARQSVAQGSSRDGSREAVLAQGLLLLSAGVQEDELREGLRYLEMAIAMSPPGRPERAVWQAQYGEALLSLYDLDPDSAEPLWRCISVLTEVSGDRALTSAPWVLCCLAKAHLRAESLTGDESHFERAGALLEEAEEPGGVLDDYWAAMIRSQRGHWFLEAHRRCGEEYLLPLARREFREAVLTHGWLPHHVQWTCARRWMELAKREAEWSAETADAYDAAISALVRLRASSASSEPIHADSPALEGLLTDAVSAALSRGDTGLSLQWLERGRGVTLTGVIQEQVFHSLDTVDPVVAAELRELSALDVEGRVAINFGLRVDRHTVQEELVRREKYRNKRVELIAGMTALRDFFDPPEASAIHDCLGDATLVYLCVGDSRGHALSMDGHGSSEVIPLEAVTRPMLEKWIGRIGEIPSGTAKDDETAAMEGNHLLAQMLGEIWRTIVEPVFEGIGVTEKGMPRRVIWCPVGMASFLPLHASQDESTGIGALDFAISSYIPTGRMLVANTRLASGNAADIRDLLGEMLAVGVPYVPGQPDLPYALEEVDRLRERFAVRPLVGADARAERVLSTLENANCLHFAGHAYNDPNALESSHLCAYDGTISFAQVVSLSRRPRGMAYLSACSTASPTERRVDEVVHIASSLLAVGFSDVIATMWPTFDLTARLMAMRVYDELLGGAQGDSAAAIRAATLELRKRYGLEPVKWAPYVHWGGVRVG